MLLPLPAYAGDPTTSGEAAALVAAKGHQLEVLTEQFDTAREQLGATQGEAQQAAAALDRAQRDLAVARGRVRGIARSAYTGSNSTLQALLTSSSADEFVDRVSILNRIAGRQSQIISQAADAERTATRTGAVAQRSAQDARSKYEAVLKQQNVLQQQVNSYQAEFERLSAQEKLAAQEAAGHGAAPRVSRANRPTDPAGSTPSVSAPVVAATGAIQTVIDTAMAQRGKPYVWAAAGPGSFDCSGLLQYAFRAAGVGLPHSSSMQSQMGKSVSRSQARPGDLVFFYTPVSHIGIYLGDGLMVHAPTSGDVVKVASIDDMGDTPGFTRIID